MEQFWPENKGKKYVKKNCFCALNTGLKYTYCKVFNKISQVAFAIALSLHNNNFHTDRRFLNQLRFGFWAPQNLYFCIKHYMHFCTIKALFFLAVNKF